MSPAATATASITAIVTAPPFSTAPLRGKKNI